MEYTGLVNAGEEKLAHQKHDDVSLNIAATLCTVFCMFSATFPPKVTHTTELPTKKTAKTTTMAPKGRSSSGTKPRFTDVH